MNQKLASSHVNRAHTLIELRRFEDAAQAAGEAIRIEPDSELPHQLRGVALLNGGDLEEALREFDACVALASDRGVHHFHRGLTLEDLGRIEEAHQAYLKANELDPSHRGARGGCKRTREALKGA